MKLLFDQHLSPKLPKLLADVFPESKHVSNVGLSEEDDNVIWQFAKKNDFVIVTKDSDYDWLATLRGFPPQVIWLRMGNCTTRQIEAALRRNQEAIISLGEQGIVEIF
ncbi:MAG: DUF5615 family PIN-like protein [Ignavibacteriae bacterium]|nr:DUF5615 family PIN-like protein [Ignavibacteriota bacterium]